MSPEERSDPKALTPEGAVRLPEESRGNQRVIDAIYRVSGFMSEVTDLKRLLTLIMQVSEEVMDSEASACMLYDSETDELFFEVALGEKAEEVKSIRLKRGSGFAGICLAEGKTLVSNDAQRDQRHYVQADKQSTYVTRNLIAIPMRYRGDIVGVLEVLNKRNDQAYDELDMRIMEIIADQAAMAIVNARLIEESIQRERLAAIGVAVSGIAHHLKNIIISFKGPLSIINMALQSGKYELIVQIAPVMQRGATRMEQSVKEMLDYSKEREPEREPGNLNDLAREVADEMRATAEQKGVTLRCALDEAISDSLLDKFRLHDAVLNLVGNAVDAHGENPQDGWVEIRTQYNERAGMLRIEVVDNGPGIPDEILKKICTPFFSTKGSKGTGLGLAVVQKVAEENGGALDIASEVGKGTTFSMRLPFLAAPATDKEDA